MTHGYSTNHEYGKNKPRTNRHSAYFGFILNLSHLLISRSCPKAFNMDLTFIFPKPILQFALLFANKPWITQYILLIIKTTLYELKKYKINSEETFSENSQCNNSSFPNTLTCKTSTMMK